MVEFCKYVTPDYKDDAFHRKVGEIYDGIIAGKSSRRIMISAPPQHGKSRLTTSLVAKWLGDRPHDPVIFTSYGADLATTHNRNARDIFESAAYRNLYPKRFTKRDKRGETRWEVADARGYSLAAGVRGPITGHGGLLGIIDDPLENWAQALSRVYREAIWDWYKSTFRTRIWENGTILVIQTRWHEEDLIGKLLADGGEDWEWYRFSGLAETPEEQREASKVLRRPVEEQADPLDREPGEALCPQRYSANELNNIRKEVGPRVWSGMYRGLPRTQEGNIFKKLWFRYWDENDVFYQLYRDESLEPDLIVKHRCWSFLTIDIAGGLKESNDPSVIGVWTVTPKWDLLLMEIYRDQINAADFLPIVQNMMRKWKCKFAGIESAGIQIKEIQYARRKGLTVKECKAEKDKLIRSITAQVRYQGSQIFHPVYSPTVSPWLAVFEDEILSFQFGCAYDDQVDVTSYAAIEVAQMQIRGSAKPPSTKPLTPTPMDLFRPI